MTTTETKERRTEDGTLVIPKGHHPAPVHSPNEFHIDPETGGLLAGLGYTQNPADVRAATPEEQQALRDREKAVAEAESRAQELIEHAKGVIAMERAKLEAEKADFAAQQAAAKERTTLEQAELLKEAPAPERPTTRVEQRASDLAGAEATAFEAGKLPEKDRRPKK
jgi:hypothetical protein